MALTKRILKLIISSPKTLTSSPIRSLPSSLLSSPCAGSIATLSSNHYDYNSTGSCWGRRSSDYCRSLYSLPAAVAALAGLTGFGFSEVAHADAASDKGRNKSKRQKAPEYLSKAYENGSGQNRSVERKEDGAGAPDPDKLVKELDALGVKVYGFYKPNVGNKNNNISWEHIAGYEQQKRQIEDTILLALRSPESYDDIARGTRRKFESNRPRAVLFEGPPGTGKTSSARVIAHQAGVPLLYVPLEVVMSKLYRESESLLGKVFTLANDLPNGAIVFLDEVDCFNITRDSEMHGATLRILSVLLHQIDGFEKNKKVVVIAATNRKQDLDPALISRFESIITFGLPDDHNRQEIAAQYAKHLTKAELATFASRTEEMSGRDIRDICQQTERRWASQVIRGQVPSKSGEEGGPPPLQEYIESALERKKALDSIMAQKKLDAQNRSKKPQLDMS